MSDKPEAIPKEQLPPFAREEGARFTANGYDWKTVKVTDTHVHAQPIKKGREDS